MADFITTFIGQSLTGTSDNDNMTFGTQIIDGVPFVATGYLSGGGGDDSFFTLNAAAIGPGGPLFNGIQYAYGNQGNDNIGLSGLFTAYGGQGNDLIQEIGGGASQQFFGGEGSDTILAGVGNDYIEGNEEADQIFGQGGNDFIWGGKGSDVINGGQGLDTIYGNLAADTISGDDFGVLGAADSLIGGQGNDIIRGGIATDGVLDDTIIGGAGNDNLTGSDGGGLDNNFGDTATVSNNQYDDIFRYQDSSAANVGLTNVDVITDFQSAVQLPPNPPGTAAAGGIAANFRPDKISLATGADAVIAGLNFTSGTQYDLNRIFVNTPNTAQDANFINADLAVVPPLFEVPQTPAPLLGTNIAGNRAINLDFAIGAAGPDGLFSSYEEVFAAINQLLVVNPAAAAALGVAAGTQSAGGWRPIASTSDVLQVYNFYSGTGAIAGTLGNGINAFLFINGQDTTVSSTTDMLIQGVNVVDGGAAIGDIVFG